MKMGRLLLVVSLWCFLNPDLRFETLHLLGWDVGGVRKPTANVEMKYTRSNMSMGVSENRCFTGLSKANMGICYGNVDIIRMHS